ncbi:LysR family transcriptional regulator [Acetobacter oeni]|uniref:LysR family transcriptional regulator n=1 Tax=Acetobacter oeni TaxID=304077 RepID=A0A511XQX3_9PROT|nr:LysR family transcriptional regulator [Acetobacter oeni]MBB3884904.1 DNA-binding transcriptional LysR family regulator [Acetobacter oeni]NHO20814.1 LysR family transcriptional regulator [Acetobacter oeni]GBR05681.1 transcriptional regulator [Acetobacter oeni LMG 21952]GEN65309.1 LysR family transcriptional regulator [Acetobacter oeni]
MDLAALADFNLVASHGGFGLASRAAKRPKTTLSRKVAELEAHLGVRLIDRGSRTLRLTPEGRALHDRTQGPLAEIGEAGQAVASGASVPRGTLRISAPIVFAHVMLPCVAADFVQAYPHVALEMVAEDRKVDPVEDNYDLVIRINPDPDERLVGRRILEDERLLVASPEMPNAFLTDQVDIAVAAVGHMATSVDAAWRIRTDRGVRELRPQMRLRFSSFLMVQDAVLAGAGVALMPKLLAKQNIAAGRLVAWGVDDGPKVEIWALQNSRRLSSSKIRAFLDVLTSIRIG